MAMSRCVVSVQNIPEYVSSGDTIVARYDNSDGSFWFYGKYEEDRAAEVAKEVDGMVMRVGESE